MDDALWRKCIEFHGHACPGLAIGLKVCEAVIEKMGVIFSKDEEIVCVTENDSCCVDAIQVIMGCSFGKGNIIHRDRGKFAFSFFNRKTDESIRIVFRNFPRIEDRNIFMEYLLNANVDELFDYKHPNFTLPEKARIFDSIPCELCGEKATENKIRIMNSKKVCLDCFKEYSRGW